MSPRRCCILLEFLTPDQIVYIQYINFRCTWHSKCVDGSLIPIFRARINRLGLILLPPAPRIRNVPHDQIPIAFPLG